ncbi:MFS transporter, partial [Paraburkholderia sp. SIMBA_049]
MATQQVNVGVAADPQTIPLRAWSVLAASTLAFMVCFVVWMMFGVLG